MNIFITSPGDRSVGIPDAHVVIDVRGQKAPSVFDSYEDGDDPREACRNAFAEFWSTFFGEEPVDVRFDDECPDCMTVRPPDQPCPRADCISNMPSDD